MYVWQNNVSGTKLTDSCDRHEMETSGECAIETIPSCAFGGLFNSNLVDMYFWYSIPIKEFLHICMPCNLHKSVAMTLSGLDLPSSEKAKSTTLKPNFFSDLPVWTHNEEIIIVLCYPWPWLDKDTQANCGIVLNNVYDAMKQPTRPITELWNDI